MFKDYKAIFKNLRDAQEQLWNESIGRVPGSLFPSGLNAWQRKTLESVNAWASQAVRQSLELQREWIGQWVERASGRSLKPRGFAELNAEARRSTQRWLEGQHRLWSQWVQLLKDTGGAKAVPQLAEIEQAVEQAMQRQMAMLDEWQAMSRFDDLSGKELGKLSNQIAKSMQKAIESQQQLWNLWFSEAAMKAGASAGAAAARPAAPKKSTPAASATAAPKPKSEPKSEPAAGADADLKQISGIGAGLEKKLKAKGIVSLQQIAELTEAQIDELEKTVIRFPGRIKRDAWVEQARALIAREQMS